MNLRKISLVNGSVSGKRTALLKGGTIGNFGSPGDQALNVRAFLSLNGSGSILAGATEGYNMAAYNQTAQISRYKYQPDIAGGSFDIQPSAQNLNSRGSMDVVPGGYTTTWNDLNSGITGQSGQQVASPLTRALVGLVFAPSLLVGNTVNLEPRTNIMVHCFIPTFSALGIKQPDQDWSLPLNDRNLSCTGETPFDSYFGHDDNTEHTSFDCQSVTWMLEEVDGHPQAPWYPVNAAVTGATQVCLGSTNTYTFGTNACSIPGNTVWSVDPNLQILSSTPNNVTVQAIYPGTGAVTATTSGVSKSLPVKVGYTSADFPITGSNGTGGNFYFYMPYCTNQIYSASIGGNTANLNWVLPSGWQTISTSGNGISFKPIGSVSAPIVANFTDVCGVQQSTNFPMYPSSTGCTIPPFTVSPNPASFYINISSTNTSYSISGAVQIRNQYGNLQYTQYVQYPVPQLSINISSLPNGPYFIVLGNVPPLQFIVQH